MYILLLLLLMAARVAARENYVIDSVCTGAERTYRIDGEKDSYYEWHLRDTSGTELTVNNPEGTDFTEIIAPGDTVWGSEINIIWENPGEYILSAYHFSVHGCDTLEQGMVKVYQAPVVFAGNQQIVCAGDTVRLNGATAQNYSSLSWTTTGDGTFEDETQLNAKYIPGTNDSIAGNVTLILTAGGMAENSTCTPAKDSVGIEVFPVVRDTIFETACESETPVAWNGQSFDESGTYQVTLTSNAGCDSIATLNLTIIPATGFVADTTICAGTPEFAWNGFTIVSDRDSVYTSTFTNAASCDSTVTLSVFVSPATELTSDTTICQGAPAFVWNGFTIVPDKDSVYTSTFTNAAGCDSIATLNLAVVPALTSTTDSTVCESDTPVAWNGQSFDESGTYQVILTSDAGCDSIATLNLEVIPEIETAPDTIICETGLPFTWYGHIFTEADTITQTIPSFTGGCDTVRTLQVQVTPAAIVAVSIIPDTTEVTEGEQVTLTAIPANGGSNPVYAWFVNGMEIPGETSATYTYTPVDGDEAYAALTTGLECAAPIPALSDTVTFTVNKQSGGLDIDAGVMPVLCYGESTGTIELTVTGGSGNYSYAWSNGETTKNIYDLPAGTYTVTVTDSNGASGQASGTIAQPAEPLELTITKEDVGESTEPAGSIDLTVSGGTAPYSFGWAGPDGFTSTAEDMNNLAAGDYTVWVTDANGCKGLLPVQIAGYGMSCPGPVILNCGIDEIPAPYTSREEYELAGGKIESTYPILDSTFTVLPDVSDGNLCPETITRTYSVKNSNGDLMTCDQLIIIQDVIKPELVLTAKFLTCPEDIPPVYYNWDDFQRYKGNGDHAGDECMLNISSFRYVKEEKQGDICDQIITRYYEIEDMCGNLVLRNEHIYIKDDNAPNIIRSADFIVTDCEIPAPYASIKEYRYYGNGIANDNCGEPVLIWEGDSIISQGCPKVVLRSYRFTDDCGNITAPYIQKITVTDPISPEIICPPDTTFNAPAEDLETLTGLPVSDIAQEIDLADTTALGLWVTDNCEIEAVTYTDKITGYCPLQIERTFTVYDACGSQAICTQRIGLEGEENPLFGTIGPLCVNAIPPELPDVSINGISGSWNPATIQTNDVGKVTYTFTPGDGQCADTATMVIEVMEETRPEFDPVGRICRYSAPPVLPSVSDNGISGSWSPDTIQTGNAGIQTYTFTPDSGLCMVPFTMEIEVIDEIVPIFAPVGPFCLNAPPSVLPATSLNGITGTWGPETIQTGNAGLTPYSFTPAPGQCATVVTIDVEVIEPVALCRDTVAYLDENGQVSINPGMVSQLILNSCDIDTTYLSKYDFDCSNVGINLVTLTLADPESVLTECTATVTVIDTVSPLAVCRDTTIQLDGNAYHKLSPEEVTTTLFDACGIDNLLLSQYEFGCEDIGTNLIELTATDINGNISNCTAAVAILGNIAPLAQPDTVYTLKNEPVNINVAQNDYDISPKDIKTNINSSSVNTQYGPARGTAEVNPKTGIVTYTPDMDFTGMDNFVYEICDDGIPCEPMCATASVVIYVREPNTPPVAEDDYYSIMCFMLEDNLLDNDHDPEENSISATTEPVMPTRHGELVISEDGSFMYQPDRDYTGPDSFRYEVCDDGIPSMCDTATVYINNIPDSDCDGISDADDIDDDNDGILDIVEGDRTFDTDGDGIFNSLDIDSDNDGIPDNIEAQGETGYIGPKGLDSDFDGWDDAYDPDNGGHQFTPVDTDHDGTPDYLDSDTDGDRVWDYIEGHDIDADGIADITRFYTDSDGDGLDDAYDIYDNRQEPSSPDNETGSNAPLQDFDGDGKRDWRDVNDDEDELLTIDEDWNNDGDYSNDDMDLDGHPDYLDIQTDCELFIPEGFSPNDDGVHDFFQIFCIQRYPEAKLMIFNRAGNKLFEKEHYGNMEYWGSDQNAWWWGTSENKWTPGKGILPAGNYIYILDLGNGDVQTGTVMISY